MWAKEGYCDSNKAHMQVPAPRCPSPPLPTIDLSAVRLAVRGARGTTRHSISHLSRAELCSFRPDSSPSRLVAGAVPGLMRHLPGAGGLLQDGAHADRRQGRALRAVREHTAFACERACVGLRGGAAIVFRDGRAFSSLPPACGAVETLAPLSTGVSEPADSVLLPSDVCLVVVVVGGACVSQGL